MSTWGRKAGSLGKDQDLCLVLLARALLSSLLSRPYAAEKDDPRRSRQLQEGLLQKELRFFISFTLSRILSRLWESGVSSVRSGIEIHNCSRSKTWLGML